MCGRVTSQHSLPVRCSRVFNKAPFEFLKDTTLKESEGDNFSIGERAETTISPSSQEHVVTFFCRRELLLAPPSENGEHGRRPEEEEEEG